MSQFDTSAITRTDTEPPVVAHIAEDSIPAARLLAHDLEALVWEDDGEGVLPPPD